MRAGVEEDASPAEIKKAYKSILRRLHPDVLDSHEEAAAGAYRAARRLHWRQWRAGEG